jgi:hypothetical protein
MIISLIFFNIAPQGCPSFELIIYVQFLELIQKKKPQVVQT